MNRHPLRRSTAICGTTDELGGELPNDLKEFHDQAGCVAAKLPNPPTAVNILTLLLESERCAIRSWIAICDMTFGKDPRTYDIASRILNEEIEHEAWSSNCWLISSTASRFHSGTFGAVNRDTPPAARMPASTIRNSPTLPQSVTSPAWFFCQAGLP